MSLLQTFSDNTQRSPWFTLLLSALVFLLCLLVMVPLLPLVLSLFYGVDVSHIQDILAGKLDGETTSQEIFRWIQGLYQLSTWGLAALIMGYFLSRSKGGEINAAKALGLNAHASLAMIGLAIMIMIGSVPLVQWIQLSPEDFQLPSFMSGWEELMREQEEISQAALQEVLLQAGIASLIANLITFALIPALCEELFFRGFLQNQLRRMTSPTAAIILQALIFSFVHFQFYGFFARTALGIILGYLYFRSNSLLPSIVGHFFFNGFSIFMGFLAARGIGISPEEVVTEIPIPWPWIAVSGLGLIAALYGFHRISPGPAKEPLSHDHPLEG